MLSAQAVKRQFSAIQGECTIKSVSVNSSMKLEKISLTRSSIDNKRLKTQMRSKNSEIFKMIKNQGSGIFLQLDSIENSEIFRHLKDNGRF